MTDSENIEIWGQDSQYKGLRLVRMKRLSPTTLKWIGLYGGGND